VHVFGGIKSTPSDSPSLRDGTGPKRMVMKSSLPSHFSLLKPQKTEKENYALAQVRRSEMSNFSQD
jgi:hypothetical protein